MIPPRYAFPAVLLGSTVGIGLALLPGWWWLTPVVAGGATAALRGSRVLVAVLLGTVVAWLSVAGLRAGAQFGRVADTVGVLALGASGYGPVVIALTGLTGLLLAGAGAWCGAMLRRSIPLRHSISLGERPHHAAPGSKD